MTALKILSPFAYIAEEIANSTGLEVNTTKVECAGETFYTINVNYPKKKFLLEILEGSITVHLEHMVFTYSAREISISKFIEGTIKFLKGKISRQKYIQILKNGLRIY